MITVIEDTAQKTGKHEEKHQQFEEMGIRLIRNKLPFGDYCLPPEISVDTKKGLPEVAYDIVGDHRRFRAECINADLAGTHLYILIEDDCGILDINDVHTWDNPELVYRPKAVTGERLEKAMKTMEARYGVRFLFCSPSEAAAMIMKILKGEYE